MMRLDTAGSTLFKLTWRAGRAPLGRRYLERAASVRRTSGSGFTSWPTPNLPSGGPNARSTETHTGGMDLDGPSTLTSWPTPQARDAFPAHSEDYIAEKVAQGHGMANLNDHVMLASWSTPCANDAEKRGSVADDPRNGLVTQANLSTWNTPRATDGSNGGPNQAGGALSADAALSAWTTPTATDGERGGEVTVSMSGSTLAQQSALTHWQTPSVADITGGHLNRSGKRALEMLLPGQAKMAHFGVFGEMPSGFPAGIQRYPEQSTGGQLNPEHSRWLMGLPRVFSSCVVSAMQSLPRSRRRG
jgi:hypothetical protein